MDTKWKDAGVRYVRGVDLSPQEIEEAKRRYAEIRMFRENIWTMDRLLIYLYPRKIILQTIRGERIESKIMGRFKKR